MNAVDVGFLKSTSDSLTVSTSLKITSEGLPALDALMIIVRSVHNCRVLGYYGGIQKLVALIKGILNFNRSQFMPVPVFFIVHYALMSNCTSNRK